MLMPVQAALQAVLGGQLAFGVDIAAVDAHRGANHKSSPFGRGLVADLGGPDLGVDAEVGRDPLHQRQRRWEVWAASTYRTSTTSTTRPGRVSSNRDGTPVLPRPWR